MDKQFLFPNISHSDYKLTRASSFSELSKSKQVITKEYQANKCGKLIKQYSYEQIFDPVSNTSQVKISHTQKSENEEHIDTWNSCTTLPTYVPLENLNWPTEFKKPSTLQKQFSFPSNNFTNFDNMNTRKLIAPAKLIIRECVVPQSTVNTKNNFHNYDQDKNPLLKVDKSSNLNSEFLIENKEDNKDSTKNKKNSNEIVKENNSSSKNKNKTDTSNLKKNLRSLVAERPKQKNKICSSWSTVFIILLSITVAYLSIFVYNTHFSKGICDPEFNFVKVPNELKKYIHGQDTAVKVLSEYFMKLNNQNSFNIITFIGETGVGKSYTAEIIKNSMRDTVNILDFFPPFFNKEDQIFASLSICRCNLITLDNLKTDDIPDAVKFISNTKKLHKNYCTLILAIFNTQETDYNLKKTLDINKSISMIDKKFAEENLQSTFVSFTAMSNEALKKCIKDAADYTNVQLSNDDITHVMHDLTTAESGCKGAYAKVQLLRKTIR